MVCSVPAGGPHPPTPGRTHTHSREVEEKIGFSRRGAVAPRSLCQPQEVRLSQAQGKHCPDCQRSG